jgi:hypothetical protein
MPSDDYPTEPLDMTPVFSALNALPAPVIPSEMDSAAVAHACEVHPAKTPYFIENWAPGLLALSVQTEILPLNAEELDAFLQIANLMMSSKGLPADHPIINTLSCNIYRAIIHVGGSAFVRLGSRSPKDYMPTDNMGQPCPVHTGQNALETLGYSERTYLDALEAKRAGYLPSICVRRFIDLSPDQEFRCFIKKGHLAGITQYHLNDGPSAWLTKTAKQIEYVIRKYMPIVTHASGIEDFTVDIAVRRDMLPFVLEINPPFSTGLVYPGLFGGLELDGTFRYL